VSDDTTDVGCGTCYDARNAENQSAPDQLGFGRPSQPIAWKAMKAPT
jgi:hypothetical protein